MLITKSEAAEQLGVSLRTIERLISAGRLPLVHVEGAARVRVADLEAYVQGLEADGRPDPSPLMNPDPRPDPATTNPPNALHHLPREVRQ